MNRTPRRSARLSNRPLEKKEFVSDMSAHDDKSVGIPFLQSTRLLLATDHPLQAPVSHGEHMSKDEPNELLVVPARRRSQRTRKVSLYFSEPITTKPRQRKKPARATKIGSTTGPGTEKLRQSPDVDHDSQLQGRVEARLLGCRPIYGNQFGLLQEVYAPDPLRVIIVAMFCNQTPGSRARPHLQRLFENYPDALALSQASVEQLAQEIRPLGLHRRRAQRLVQLATSWLERPPVLGVVSSRKGLSKDIGYPDTEISHLPGCGPYAMDSYRLFCTGEGWRSVRPDDKELLPYVQWRWSREGIDYKKLLQDESIDR